MGLETFLFQKKPCMTVYSVKTFHGVFTAIVRIHIASQLLYGNKIFYTMLFSIDVHWNTSPWNWRNCLLDVFLNAPWKLFYVNLPFERLFVTFWKLFCSHAITLRWLDDAKESIRVEQTAWLLLLGTILAADAGRFESHGISWKLFGG